MGMKSGCEDSEEQHNSGTRQYDLMNLESKKRGLITNFHKLLKFKSNFFDSVNFELPT